MNAVSIADLDIFAQRWMVAGGMTVQHWSYWEEEAAKFFGIDPAGHMAVMHGLMRIVLAVLHGPIVGVKQALRDAEPAALEMARVAVGHLPAFSAIVTAEIRYRQGQLSGDWTLHTTAGSTVVRSEFAKPNKETSH